MYDDAENYPQKFTANYLFLINATESDLPRVNQPSRDRRTELIGIGRCSRPVRRSAQPGDRRAQSKAVGRGGSGRLERTGQRSLEEDHVLLDVGTRFHRYQQILESTPQIVPDLWTKKVRQLFRMSREGDKPFRKAFK